MPSFTWRWEPYHEGGTVELVTIDGVHRRLAGPYGAVSGLAWSPSGDEVWYTGGIDAASVHLRAVSRDGKDRLVLEAPGRVKLHDIAPDGRALLERQIVTNHVYGHVPAGEVALSWFYGSRTFDLTADGKLLLGGDRGGAGRGGWLTYLRPTDGSPAIFLGAGGGAGALSPDGKWALVSRVPPYVSSVS